MGAFTIEALQLWEPLNILSFTLSLVTLLYGIGDHVALKSHGNVEVDFSMTVYGVLANMIDAGLRVLFFAYISTLIKGFVFVILLVYVVIVFIILWHQGRDNITKSTRMIILPAKALNAMYSLPCSGFETLSTLDEDKSRVRTISKAVFSCLFIVSLIFVGISTNSDNFNGIGYALKKSSHIDNANCTNICVGEFDEICLESWKHMDESHHLIAQIVLISLFCLSLLEWVLEKCFDCMPYNKLY